MAWRSGAMPGVGRVLGAIFFERLDDGALDVLGRGEIRLAGAEVRDIHALGLQFFGFLQHHHGRRDADAIDAIGELNSSFHFLFRGRFHHIPSIRKNCELPRDATACATHLLLKPI